MVPSAGTACWTVGPVGLETPRKQSKCPFAASTTTARRLIALLSRPRAQSKTTCSDREANDARLHGFRPPFRVDTMRLQDRGISSLLCLSAIQRMTFPNACELPKAYSSSVLLACVSRRPSSHRYRFRSRPCPSCSNCGCAIMIVASAPPSLTVFLLGLRCVSLQMERVRSVGAQSNETQLCPRLQLRGECSLVAHRPRDRLCRAAQGH